MMPSFSPFSPLAHDNVLSPPLAHDDDVLLAALEGVNARDLDVVVELRLERAVLDHVCDEVRALALVRRDDADLQWGGEKRKEGAGQPRAQQRVAGMAGADAAAAGAPPVAA